MSTILVINDDLDELESIVSALELFNDNVAVIGFARSLQPHELLARNVAGVVCDMMLLGPQNGVEVAHSLRERGFAGTLIGTSASHEELRRAEQSGLFDACLPAPFKIADLLALLPL